MTAEIIDHVLTDEEIKAKKWTFSNFIEFLGDNDLEAAASLGLVRNTRICEICTNTMVLHKKASRAIGYVWNCPTRTCKSSAGIRKNSLLELSRLSLNKFIKLLFFWSMEMSQCKIQEEIQVSSRTIVEWMFSIRKICEQDILNNPIKLGGMNEKKQQPKIVEIDSFFKYERERSKNGVWIFGAVERETGRCNLQVVENRERETLLPIIKLWILPDTKIVKCNNYPEDPSIHTETEDGFWSSIRKKKETKMAKENLFHSHMMEELWKQREKGHLFSRILICIRQQYSFSEKN